MAEILITVASRYGHTGKIASQMSDRLRAAGHHVHLCDDVEATDPCPTDYDLVIVGAGVRNGHHAGAIAEWARHHAVSLNMRPSAFFSVCLAAAEDSDAARAKVQGYLDDFEERTGWLPRLRTTFAGAVQYDRYALPTRAFMQVMLRRAGHPTDGRHDQDFTDWDAVAAFAQDCAALLAPAKT